LCQLADGQNKLTDVAAALAKQTGNLEDIAAAQAKKNVQFEEGQNKLTDIATAIAKRTVNLEDIAAAQAKKNVQFEEGQNKLTDVATAIAKRTVNLEDIAAAQAKKNVQYEELFVKHDDLAAAQVKKNVQFDKLFANHDHRISDVEDNLDQLNHELITDKQRVDAELAQIKTKQEQESAQIKTLERQARTERKKRKAFEKRLIQSARKVPKLTSLFNLDPHSQTFYDAPQEPITDTEDSLERMLSFDSNDNVFDSSSDEGLSSSIFDAEHYCDDDDNDDEPTVPNRPARRQSITPRQSALYKEGGAPPCVIVCKRGIQFSEKTPNSRRILIATR
jgi:chromosome segregation ATPase